MAYSTGSATDPNDLITKLKNFVEANGWTVNMFAVTGAGYRLHVQKGGLFVNIRSAVNESVSVCNTDCSLYGLALNGSTGFSATPPGGALTQQWRNQPGAPVGTSTLYGNTTLGLSCHLGGMTGTIPSYHFFANSDAVHGVVEVSSGTFQHFCFGQLETFGIGDALDSFFVSASSHSNEVNLAHHVFTTQTHSSISSPTFMHFGGLWYSLGTSSTSVLNTGQTGNLCFSSTRGTTGTNSRGTLHSLARAMPSGLGALTPLFPSYMSVNIGANKFVVGHIPSVRCTMATGFTPGDEVTIGGDVWKIFPTISVTETDPYAIAIKKVV